MRLVPTRAWWEKREPGGCNREADTRRRPARPRRDRHGTTVGAGLPEGREFELRLGKSGRMEWAEENGALGSG